MLPRFSRSSSSSGNGVGSQAPMYCSMLVLSCTLFLARLYNQAHHISPDSRHDQSISLLRPLLSLSSPSSLSIRRSIAAAALTIPVLSSTIQAAPTSIPDAHYIGELSSHSPSSASSSSTTSTSTKKSTKSTTTGVPSPTPSPDINQFSEVPHQATNTLALTDPSEDNSPEHSAGLAASLPLPPSQARTEASPSATTDSHLNPNPSAVISDLFDGSSSTGGARDGNLPNNNDNDHKPSSTARHAMSPSALISATVGSIAAVVAVVVGIVVVRGKIVSRRRRMQEEMDFEGPGAYSGGGGMKGKGKKQQKTEYHVGLTSFGSTNSSVVGGGGGGDRVMSTTGIKKPPPLAQREQFWNP